MSLDKIITIFGLGYVGLPLSLCYTLKNIKVYGIDILEEHVNNLKLGITSLKESHNNIPIEKILNNSIENKLFFPSTSVQTAMKESDTFIITIGIPNNLKGLDFSYIESACKTIAKGLKQGNTVMIRSTVVPGTTEERLLPILESTGLKAGKDFYLVYCPERISEGNAFREFTEVPVVLSGINEESIQKGIEIIKIISSEEPIILQNIITAETVKVVENIQRDVNIAIVQQLAGLCKRIDVDIFKLIDAVNTHPRVNLLKPGPGVGGYCIPNALHYLYPKADEVNANIELLALARIINQRVPQNIVKEIIHELKILNKDIQECKVGVLGISMKDYCSDDRLSPVIDIVKTLLNNGIHVNVYDPCVTKSYFFKVDSIESCLKNADCLLIGALQEGINYHDYSNFKALMNTHPLIYDTRNIINKSTAEKRGFKVLSI